MRGMECEGEFLMQKFCAKKYYILTFIISILYRMTHIAGEYQMRLVQDDIGMLSGTAYFAGYDWSSVTATTRYYGIGYYVLFTPLFRFIDNPMLLWFVIISLNIVLISLTCVLVYHIGIKYLNMEQGFITVMISVISSFVIISFRTMSQEPVLFFLTWLMTFLLIKIFASKYRTFIYIVMLLVMSYAYLIHSRAAVFWIGAFGICFMYSIKKRCVQKKIKILLIALVSMGIVYIAAGFLKDAIIQLIWGSSGNIANSEIPIDSNIFSLFSFKGLLVCIDMFVANTVTTSIRLSGLNIVALIIFLMSIFMNWEKIEYRHGIEFRKIIILLFSFICFLVGMIGVSVLWGEGVVSSYFTDDVSYSYKGFSYYRYYATFLGPSIFVALNECINNDRFKKMIKMPVLCVQASLCIYFYTIILKNISASEYVNSVPLEYVKFNGDGMDVINFRLSLFLSFGMLLIWLIVHNRKTRMISTFACLAIAVIPYLKNIETGILARPQLNTLADGGYNLMKELEQQNCLPDKIYCDSATRSYRYQFQIKKYPIIIGYPAENENAVFFTGDNRQNENIDENYKCIQIDANEYIWTNDKVIYEATKNWLENISIEK